MIKWKFTLHDQDFVSSPVGKVRVSALGLHGKNKLTCWGMSTLIELSFAGLNLRIVW